VAVFRGQGSKFRVQGSKFRVQGSRFKVQGSRFKVQSSRFRVQGSGFKVQGSRFRVQGSGFRIRGSGFNVRGWCTHDFCDLRPGKGHLELQSGKVVKLTVSICFIENLAMMEASMEAISVYDPMHSQAKLVDKP
jgi:hypothetical protein